MIFFLSLYLLPFVELFADIAPLVEVGETFRNGQKPAQQNHKNKSSGTFIPLKLTGHGLLGLFDAHPPEEKQEAFVSQVRQGWFELDQSMEVGLQNSKITEVNELDCWMSCKNDASNIKYWVTTSHVKEPNYKMYPI